MGFPLRTVAFKRAILLRTYSSLSGFSEREVFAQNRDLREKTDLF